jgi:hypothetical protein
MERSRPAMRRRSTSTRVVSPETAVALFPAWKWAEFIRSRDLSDFAHRLLGGRKLQARAPRNPRA